MEIGETLYLTTRKDWREWLSKNHQIKKDIWLIFYRKATGRPRISYDDAVLEALCFGWIDSIVKKIDEEKFAQRFSPRRKTSVLSEMNRQRIAELIKEKKMTKAGMDVVKHLYAQKQTKPSRETLDEIKKNKDAWKYFNAMPARYKNRRLAYIENAKYHSQQMYQKALQHFITKTAQNKRIGFVKERTYEAVF